MITCNLMGGLGNQLFQIFTTISYAIRTQQMFHFYNSEFTIGSIKRETYWESLFSRLKPFLHKEFPPLEIIKEKEFSTWIRVL